MRYIYVETVIVSPLSIYICVRHDEQDVSLGLLNLGFAKGLFGKFETCYLLMSSNSVKLMNFFFKI